MSMKFDSKDIQKGNIYPVDMKQKMKKEEWEKFWEYLENRASEHDEWWLLRWLLEEKQRYECKMEM